MAGVAHITGRQPMPDLLIRGMDPEALSRLKEQAARHGRSMQAEAKSIVEAGIRPTMAAWLERVDHCRTKLEAVHGVLRDSSVEYLNQDRAERESRLSPGKQ